MQRSPKPTLGIVVVLPIALAFAVGFYGASSHAQVTRLAPDDFIRANEFRAKIDATCQLQLFDHPFLRHKLEFSGIRVLKNSNALELFALNERKKEKLFRLITEYEETLSRLMRCRDRGSLVEAKARLRDSCKAISEFIEDEFDTAQQDSLSGLLVRHRFWEQGPIRFIRENLDEGFELGVESREMLKKSIIEGSWEIQAELIENLLEGQPHAAKQFVVEQLIEKSEKIPCCISIVLSPVLAEEIEFEPDWLPDWPVFKIDPLGNLCRDQNLRIKSGRWPLAIFVAGTGIREHLSFELTPGQMARINPTYKEYVLAIGELGEFVSLSGS